MNTCAVYGCNNSLAGNADPAIQYYYFPKHPVFAQQWVSACWATDTIDINYAQVCSIHFEDNSYSSEFKLVDYLGHCTRMLKYDAVPTLYLPNPQQHVLLRNTIDKQPISLNITNAINPSDIKNLVIYDVENVTFNSNTSHSQAVIPVNTELLNVGVSKQDSHIPDLHKFDPVQLHNLKNENKILKENITEVENSIKNLKSQINEKTKNLEDLDEQLSSLMQEHDMMRRSRMSYAYQKKILSKVFSASQLKILSGSKKIYWSNDDMAMGYTLRNMSNKRFYMYLTKNLNIPLPALSSIQRWAALKKGQMHKLKTNNEKYEDENSS